MRKTKIVAGEYYHFYNRGVDRAPIFFCEENWPYFLRRMRTYFTPNAITVVAYCLMPNHYHLLVRANQEDVPRTVMQPFTVSYAKSVNKQQARTGPLFQGPFHARHVDDDAYLTWLSRYIHLNPVAAGLVSKPAGWEYSSYQDYIGLRSGTLPHPEIVLSQFPSRQAYAEFVETPGRQDAGLPERLLFPE
jgi:putative transposase